MSEVRIIDNETGEVVRSFDTTGQSQRQAEKLMLGIEINLDHERFHVTRTPETYYGLRIHTTDGPKDYYNIVKGSLRIREREDLSFVVKSSNGSGDVETVTIPGGAYSHWVLLDSEGDRA